MGAMEARPPCRGRLGALCAGLFYGNAAGRMRW